MTYNEIQAAIRCVRFRDWAFDLLDEDDRWFLRVTFPAPCTATGSLSVVHGRKWRLSPHMTRSEVVLTALKAVLTALEHEAREDFLYRDKAIFGPHLDVDVLHEIADEVDVRPERRTAQGVERQGVTRPAFAP